MLEVKLNGIKDVVVNEVQDLAPPQLGWVTVQSKAVSICGSDMHVYLGVNPVLSPPRVQGHEFAGEVVATNEQDKHLLGKRVTVNPVIGCGECEYCGSGYTYRCEKSYVIGGEVTGAFAGQVYVPTRNIVEIPDDMSYVDATLAEPTAVAVHTVGDIKNSNVLIIGQGAIGLLCLQVALKQGNKVIAMDVSDDMLKVSKQLGSFHIINSKTDDVKKELETALKGEKLDCVIDAVCNPITVNMGIDIVKKSGKIVFVGIPKEAFLYDMIKMLCKEITIETSYLYSDNDFKQALNLVENKTIDAKTIVSKVFNATEASKAFEYKLDVPSIKVVVEYE